MDLVLAEQAITEQTGALIATSLFGFPVDLDRLQRIRGRYPHVHIVQDCAHGFAAEWRGRPVQREGVAALFGLNIGKLITSIFGGLVTTDDMVLAEHLRNLRETRFRPPSLRKSLRRLAYLLAVYPAFWEPAYGLVNRLERLGWLESFVRYYDEARVDMPADYLEAMTPLEARVGRAQITRYRDIVSARRRLAVRYDAALREVPAVGRPPLVEGATYSHYVPRVSDREARIAAALEQRVQLGRLLGYSIPDLPAYRNARSVPQGCPVARRLAETTINLPTSWPVTAVARLFLDAPGAGATSTIGAAAR
jgi:dTDP-4-amino-4,6-dideoxygalactose transaminase